LETLAELASNREGDPSQHRSVTRRRTPVDVRTDGNRIVMEPCAPLHVDYLNVEFRKFVSSMPLCFHVQSLRCCRLAESE
jgi:hypothetical protein